MPEHDVPAVASMPAVSSRDRILLSAKHLFARNGYENTSTVAIAREAGTSESQLMKHFGSKQGLLAAIFDRGWANIIERVQTAHRANSPLERLMSMLDAVILEVESDQELKELAALEARRVRKDNRDVLISRGYQQFGEMMRGTLAEMRDQGHIRAGSQSRRGALRHHGYDRSAAARPGRRQAFRIARRLRRPISESCWTC